MKGSPLRRRAPGTRKTPTKRWRASSSGTGGFAGRTPPTRPSGRRFSPCRPPTTRFAEGRRNGTSRSSQNSARRTAATRSASYSCSRVFFSSGTCGSTSRRTTKRRCSSRRRKGCSEGPGSGSGAGKLGRRILKRKGGRKICKSFARF